MTQQDLQRQIKKRQFAEVYFLYGKEEFLLERSARNLALSALADGDPSFNYQIFWGSETKIDEIVSAANAFPFLSEKRVILVREADSLLKEKRLMEYVSNPNPTTVLILTASAPAKKTRSSKAKARVHSTDVFSYLQSRENAMKQDVTLEFKEMREPMLLAWIRGEFESRGMSIDQQGAMALMGMKGNSTGEIASEIEKILTAHPEKAAIDETDIVALLGATRQFDVFQLSDAVLSLDESKAQEILLRLLKTEQPGRIIFQLSRDISILWREYRVQRGQRSSEEEAYKLGLSFGWQLDKIRAHISKFHNEEYFERCFESILEADASLKTGSGRSEDVIMSTLIHQLAGRRASF